MSMSMLDPDVSYRHFRIMPSRRNRRLQQSRRPKSQQ
jgi:hypothetical protein